MIKKEEAPLFLFSTPAHVVSAWARPIQWPSSVQRWLPSACTPSWPASPSVDPFVSSPSSDSRKKPEFSVLVKMIMLQSGLNVIKLVFFLSDDEAKIARAFVPGKPFQPSLIFTSKVPSLGWAPGHTLLDQAGKTFQGQMLLLLFASSSSTKTKFLLRWHQESQNCFSHCFRY